MSDAVDWLALLDWRRRMAELYARVRALRAGNMVPAHTAWLEGRSRLYREHAQSPVPAAQRERFGRLRSWPYDPAYAYAAALEPLPPERFSGPVSRDGHEIGIIRIGAVTLPLGRLDVFWIDDYGGGLFIPFQDKTSGASTYGGGRYLIDTAKGSDLGSAPDGRLILDFNFAYHPSCAFDPQWACPLAPPSNHLDGAVEAGERLT